MPKSATINEDATEGAVIHSVANGINEKQLQGFVAEIEAEQAKIDAKMEEARKACQPHLDEIKKIMKEAAEAGVQKKPFRAKLRERSLLRRAEHVTDHLDDDAKDVFAEISAKLRDMPNFQGLDG